MKKVPSKAFWQYFESQGLLKITVLMRGKGKLYTSLVLLFLYFLFCLGHNPHVQMPRGCFWGAGSTLEQQNCPPCGSCMGTTGPSSRDLFLTCQPRAAASTVARSSAPLHKPNRNEIGQLCKDKPAVHQSQVKHMSRLWALRAV